VVGDATRLPPLLELAGHPVRWAILRGLARGDLRVRELTEEVGERQSLVSYHLKRLRSDGLVTSRRSSFDGRDTYYRTDVARCRELLAQAGAALHPALGAAAPATSVEAVAPARVLFLCTGNSSRSQIAEALLRRMAPGGIEAFSAGSSPKPVHPDAIRVMREHDIDISAAESKHLSVFAGERFDHVISLCDRVREVCPDFPGSPETAHWSVPDPASDPAGRAAFERVADELAERIGFFLHVLSLRPTDRRSN
jgi:ArsR family transcriptional regulator, arsenate/arsenite/antimonite-responsive transcriptional repressor / arsenate reductase (thioredoxin)